MIATYAIFGGCSIPFFYDSILEVVKPGPDMMRLVFGAVILYTLLTVILIVLLVTRLMLMFQRYEKALRESEEKFRTLVVSIREWIWEVNGQAEFTYSSPYVRELLGYRPNELLGKRPFDFMSPDEAERMAGHFHCCTVQEPFCAMEMRFRHKQGHIVIVEMGGTPVLGAQEQYQGLRGIGRNITERKRAEEIIRESEERYRSLYENMSEGIMLFDLVYDDQHLVDYVIRDMNPACETMLEVKWTDAVGQSAGALADHLHGLTDIPYLPRFARAAADGMTMHQEIHLPEIHKHFLAAVFTPRDGQFAVLLADITDRKQVEDALFKASEFYRLLFDEFPLPIWRSDADGRIVYFNNAWKKLTGLKEQSGESILDVMHPEDADRYVSAYTDALRALKPFQVEYRIMQSNGQYGPGMHVGQPVQGPDGSFMGFLGFYSLTGVAEYATI